MVYHLTDPRRNKTSLFRRLFGWSSGDGSSTALSLDSPEAQIPEPPPENDDATLPPSSLTVDAVAAPPGNAVATSISPATGSPTPPGNDSSGVDSRNNDRSDAQQLAELLRLSEETSRLVKQNNTRLKEGWFYGD